MRFFGKIGYGDEAEDPAGSGNWKAVITEFSYYGDVIRNTRQLEAGDKVNDDITLGNSISIVADQYAVEHFMTIKYAEWAGVRWTVTNVEVKPPRLILSIGDVYNGPEPEEEP